MEFAHRPVLLEAVTEAIRVREKRNGVFADGTLGGGGHAAALCAEMSASGVLVGMDRDAEAVEAARRRLEGFACGRLLEHGSFERLPEALDRNGIGAVDGALLDLGVSSFQLDNPERGFSYMRDAPLDMRMDASGGFTAADVVNDYDRDALTRVIAEYGEERWASRISAFIVRERRKSPIRRTSELCEVIKAAIPASARREGPHPAKRTFQAIRIEVNDELGILERALDGLADRLLPGGRLCVISFHSLEDRIVKTCFARRESPCVCPKDLPVCACGRVSDGKRVNVKPILPEAAEREANPRARSAKLRVFEKRSGERGGSPGSSATRTGERTMKQ